MQEKVKNGRKVKNRYYASLIIGSIIPILNLFFPVAKGEDTTKIMFNGKAYLGEGISQVILNSELAKIANLIFWISLLIVYLGISISSYSKISTHHKEKRILQIKRNRIGGILIFVMFFFFMFSWGIILQQLLHLKSVNHEIYITITFYVMPCILLINSILGFSQVIKPDYSVNLFELKDFKKESNEIIEKGKNSKKIIGKLYQIPLRLGLTLTIIFGVLFTVIFTLLSFNIGEQWVQNDSVNKTTLSLFSIVFGFLCYNEILSLMNRNSKIIRKQKTRKSIILNFLNYPQIVNMQKNMLKICVVASLGAFVTIGGLAIILSLGQNFLECPQFIFNEGGITTWDNKLSKQILYWLIVCTTATIFYGFIIIICLIALGIIFFSFYLIGWVLEKTSYTLIANLVVISIICAYINLEYSLIRRTGSFGSYSFKNIYLGYGILLTLFFVLGTIVSYFGTKRKKLQKKVTTKKLDYSMQLRNKDEVTFQEIDSYIKITERKLSLPVELLENGITYTMVEEIESLIENQDEININWISIITRIEANTVKIILEQIFGMQIFGEIARKRKIAFSKNYWEI